jgi:mxaD protein
VGAVRLLTLADGGTIKEKLLAFDEATHSYQYTIVEGVLPVSDYVSTFTLTADGEAKTTATWSGSFKRKDVSDQPAADGTDQVATDAVTGVYTSGLDNLKKVLETK